MSNLDELRSRVEKVKEIAEKLGLDRAAERAEELLTAIELYKAFTGKLRWQHINITDMVWYNIQNNEIVVYSASVGGEFIRAKIEKVSAVDTARFVTKVADALIDIVYEIASEVAALAREVKALDERLRELEESYDP